MAERRTVGRAVLAGVAGSGVLLGHWLTYLVAVPRDQARDELLRATGHGYWFLAAKVALVLAVTSIGAAAIRGMSSRDRGLSAPHCLARLARRLVLMQTVAFAALEVGERIAVGAPLGGLFEDHVSLLLGLAVQVLVACAATLVLVAVGYLARRAAGVLRFRPKEVRSRVSLRPRAPLTRPAPALAGAFRIRAPPPS